MSTAQEVLGDSTRGGSSSMAPIVVGGSVGTILEWYDFLVYVTATSLVFNQLFFPNLDPFTGTLAAFGTNAVGFLARPAGAALFGHFGDRLGRKAMLMVTMTVMGLSTFAIGLLPTYAQVGIWAPVLLVALRIIQGIGLGGEWGGASIMVLEHAPASRRGFFGGLVQIGFPMGLLISSFAFTLAINISGANFLSWGWRLPFLASLFLLGVGWFVRARVPETPVFEKMKQAGNIARNPFYEAVFKDTRNCLIAVGLKISEVSWVYVLTTSVVFYATTKLNLPKPLLLNAIALGSAIELVTIPLFGWLSDIYGRRAFYFAGALFTMAFAFPLFWMLETKDPTIITLTLVAALNFGHGTMFGLQSAYFPELFGMRARYTGASVGFQLSAAIGGGLVPLLATWLAGLIGGTTGISVLMICLALITFIATLAARETKGAPLRD